MMAPTERSMPAVRMTSVWAMPSVAMIVTCCRTSDRLNGCEEPVSRRWRRTDDAEQQHEERNGRRIWVQEVLDALDDARRSSSNDGDGLRRARQHCLELSRPAAARSWHHRLPRVPLDAMESSRCRRSPIGDASRIQPKGSAPAELQAFVDRDRRHAVDRLVGDQSCAPVSKKPMPGVDLGLLAVLANRRSPRAPSRPSSADIAARSRRSRRPGRSSRPGSRRRPRRSARCRRPCRPPSAPPRRPPRPAR